MRKVYNFVKKSPMITNKIINTIISIISFIVIPIQMVTTFVLGILVSLTFGLLLIPLSLVWVICFFGPLLGLSYLYEKFFIIRPLIALIGIPIAVLGDIYVSLLPTMGEIESRYAKLIYCETFPYTWSFHQFCINKFILNDNDVLNKIFEEVAKTPPLGEYLEKMKMNKTSKQI